MGRAPTHLDSHQHAHREEPLRSQLVSLGRSLEIPVRHESPTVRYEGGFYGQDRRGWPMGWAIGVEHLLGLLLSLPPGVTELGCHPAERADLDSMYRNERALELETLCDPRVLATLRFEGIRLGSFHELASTAA
jgi:chitin disaccharide deacetylase